MTRGIMRIKELKNRMERWSKAGPVCPRHGIPSERFTFTIEGRKVRGWRCKKRDFEILHPKDADALFRARRARANKPKTIRKDKEKTGFHKT